MRVNNDLRYLFLAVILMIGMSICFVFSCHNDDDEDDDENKANETDDDDATTDDDDDDDDDDDEHECEELYDVIIDGETEMGATSSLWIGKLTISQSGSIIGVVVPDSEEIDQYAISGFRYDQTTGYIKCSFPTPASMAGECAEASIFNYMDMTFTTEGTTQTMTGIVTFYCGAIDPANEMSVYTATGTVTCGDFGV